MILEVVLDVAERLERAGLRYVIGGSIASSVWGQMRQTNDADFAVRMDREDVDKLVSAFGDPYYVSSLDVEEAFRERKEYRTIQILHMDEVFKIDVFVVGDDPFVRSEFERAKTVALISGRSVKIACPETIVIQKLRWYRLGNMVSDRQWNDIVQVLETQSERLDWSYLREWANHFGLGEWLEKARSEAIDPCE
ncbi:hypothetical protein BH11ARM2_BH11ARM2_29130 [soil metagenome]